MASSKSSLALFALAMAMAMAVVASAQNSPQDFVKLHNSERAQVGVGPVVWNETVAKYAQDFAAQRSGDCLLQYSDRYRFGENLFWGWGKSWWSGQPWSAADAVKMWADEKHNYHAKNNTCDAGKVCLHYTQVVWRETTRIGCARVTCPENRVFIVCNYDPPGNIYFERPY